MKAPTKRHNAAFGKTLLCAAALLVLSSVFALSVGRYTISPLHVLHVLAGADHSVASVIVWRERLPRLLAAILIGAALSVSGAAYQAVFRNPLVSPGLLGVLSGSAFGAALAIYCGVSVLLVQFGAFAGGVMAVCVGLGIARMSGQKGALALLLGGLISNAIFTALLSLLKYTADPLDQLPAIVYWLLGSLAQIHWSQIDTMAPLLGAGTIVLILCARMLNVLSLSDDEALSLGVPVTALRLATIGLATFLSALTVSLAGIIGWVGLLMPHIARLMVGGEHSRMLPLCALVGALAVVLSDLGARSFSAGEIPLGMMTELFGAVGFILILRRLKSEVM
ncbi:FecCD family ABC transporter permease [Kozakia baliensis]|uniref:FecCD family ABC transporter permease n=1 Tax=Kozakia baliensis TaxID=153496 RepID=UPI00068A6078|nr:iron ABC transporter permease [Kozakia baliensis]